MIDFHSGSVAVSSSTFSIPALGPMVGSGPGSPSRLFAAQQGAAAAAGAAGAPNSATPSSVGGTQSPFSALAAGRRLNDCFDVYCLYTRHPNFFHDYK